MSYSILWNNESTLWLDIIVSKAFLSYNYSTERNRILISAIKKVFDKTIPFTSFPNRAGAKDHIKRIKQLNNEEKREKLLKDKPVAQQVYKLENTVVSILEWIFTNGPSVIEEEEVINSLFKEKNKNSTNSKLYAFKASFRLQNEIKSDKVLVVYTGGTFGMIGKPLHTQSLDELILATKYSVPLFYECFYGPTAFCKAVSTTPIDSSAMKPTQWYDIAELITKELFNCKIEDKTTTNNYKYRGVVVIHGTDTLAYTAAGLHYLLHKIAIPVIITGAQKPLLSSSTDGLNNFLGAISIAKWGNDKMYTPGVSVFFNRKLMEGACILKHDSLNFDAFESPKSPYIAVESSSEINFNHRTRKKMIFRTHQHPFRLYGRPSNNIALIHLFPGINEQFIENACTNADGVIISAHGVGNGSNEVVEAVKTLVNQGKVVAINSECMKGRVGDFYSASLLYHLKNCPIIDCQYLTTEASFSKLAVVLGMTANQEKAIYIWKEFTRKGLDPSGGDQAIG